MTTNIPTALDLGMQLAGLTEGSPIQSDTVRGVESTLGVRLPDEFARICEFYDQRGIASGYLAHVSAESSGNTIVALTQRLRREQGLPTQYVALGAADKSVLLLTVPRRLVNGALCTRSLARGCRPSFRDGHP